jgi:hypothetical protein
MRSGPWRHTAGHNVAAYHHDADKVMVELHTEMDVFIPELGICEPRPVEEPSTASKAVIQKPGDQF